MPYLSETTLCFYQKIYVETSKKWPNVFENRAKTLPSKLVTIRCNPDDYYKQKNLRHVVSTDEAAPRFRFVIFGLLRSQSDNNIIRICASPVLPWPQPIE